VTIVGSSKSVLVAGPLAMLLAACGGTALPPPSASSATPSLRVGYPVKEQSWIKPGAAKGQLLYVSSLAIHAVYIFSYPRLGLVGMLGQYRGYNQPVNICSDQEGNVFVPMVYDHKILEFAHGGTQPIAILRPGPGDNPYSCSYDPTTGNLAVGAGVEYGTYMGVLIYKSVKSKPTTYIDPYITNDPVCGYDNQGNLFVDGDGGSTGFFAFSELPKNTASFLDVTINQKISSAGNVQWDGKYMTVFDGIEDIYRLKITGSSATVVGSTTLNDVGAYGTWILGHHVIAPDEAHAEVKIFRYPKGGDPIRSTALVGAFSATVSNVPMK
jgi:hypothetical protein